VVLTVYMLLIYFPVLFLRMSISDAWYRTQPTES